MADWWVGKGHNRSSRKSQRIIEELEDIGIASLANVELGVVSCSMAVMAEHVLSCYGALGVVWCHVWK